MRGIFFRFLSIGKLIFQGKQNRTVGGAAFVIAVFGIVSRLLGFVRDRILAGTFGAGDMLDVYYAAFRIPDFLYGFFLVGALSAAFIPVFTELREKRGDASSWELANGIFFLLFFFLGVCSLVVAVFATPITAFLVSGFSPEKQVLTVTLTRVMLIGPMFLGMSAVFGSILVSYRNFIVYSFAPVLYNVGIILGVTVFSKFFGPIGLAYGVVFGTALHFLIQYPTVRRTGFIFSWHVSEDIRKQVWHVLRLMVPRSLGVAVGQVGVLAGTFFASALASGTLAAFTLATNISSVPLGLFGVAFSLAAFPTLSALIARGEYDRFSDTVLKTARKILFFVLPVSALIIVLRAQIVRVILGTGQFDWDDTMLTFDILGVLAASLFAQSLIPLFARAFFSLQDTKIPFLLALVSEVIHIILLFAFVDTHGSIMLAVSFSVASIVNLLLLYAFLKRRLSLWRDSVFFLGTAKIVVASFLAMMAAQAGKSLFHFVDEVDTFIEVFSELIVCGLLGAGVFVFVAWVLKIEELESVRCFIVSRFLKNPEVLKESEEESTRPVV